MIYAAQIDEAMNLLKQGLAFSNKEIAEAHFNEHREFMFIATDEFVSPETHEYLNGKIVKKGK